MNYRSQCRLCLISLQVQHVISEFDQTQFYKQRQHNIIITGMKSAWSEIEMSANHQEDSYVPEANHQLINIEQRLTQLLETNTDVQLLLEVTKFNRGDAGEAMALAVSRIKEDANEEQLKDLQGEIERLTMIGLVDQNRKRDIQVAMDNAATSINQKLKTVTFESNQLLSCLKSTFTSDINEVTKLLVTDLINKCEGGATYVSLDAQIAKVMAISIPKVKNQEAEVKFIIQNKNFSNIQKIATLNKFEQDRFIGHVKCLKAYQEYVLYGDSVSECRNSFILSAAKELTSLSNNWHQLSFVLEQLVKDPLYDFSKSRQLSDEVKETIYSNIYNMKEFNECLKLTDFPKSLKFRQREEITNIIRSISEHLKPREEDELRQLLDNYDFLELYRNDNVGQARMLKLHNFIEKCPDYLKYQHQREACYDQTKSRLIVGLRQYLLKIGVPFQAHQQIEELVFQRYLYDLLDAAISKDHKKQLFDWISKYMVTYYKSKFNPISFREETKSQLISLLIKLDLELTYKVIVEIVHSFLDKVDAKELFTSSNLNETQKKQIKKVVRDNKVVRNYVENLGIDTKSLKFDAESVLVWDIMVPDEIGCLHGESTKKFVQAYLQNPENSTINKSDLPESQKKKLLISTEKKLKEFKTEIKRVSAGTVITNYEKYLKDNLDTTPDYQGLVWKAIQDYGYLRQDEEGNLDMANESEDLQQIKGILESENEQDLRKTLKIVQSSEEFHLFKFQFQQLTKRKFKQLEEELSHLFTKQLDSKKYDEAEIDDFVEAAQNANYALEVLQQISKFKKMASICAKMPAYISYKAKKQSIQSENEFLKQVQQQQKLIEILQGDSFSKYTNSEKHEIVSLFRKLGNSFVDQIEDILTKNDANNLRTFFCVEEEKLIDEEERPRKVKQSQLQNKKSPKIDHKQSVQSSNSNQKGKSVPLNKWKSELKKKCGKTYEDVLASFQLIKLVGQQLKSYDQKEEIIEEYHKILQNEKAKVANQILSYVENPANESLIKGLNCYEDLLKGNICIILEDFVWTPLALEELKSKYEVKVSAKLKKIRDEIEGPLQPNVEKIAFLRNELDKLKQIS